MRETFNPGFLARDFRTRYNHSYGFYHTESGRRVFVQMSAIDDNTALFKDALGTTFRANAGGGVEFEFIPVPKKLFVFEKNLHFIRRKLARQFSRGINEQNTTLTDLATGRVRELGFDRLEQMLKPAEAVADFAKWQRGELNGVALTDQFGIQGNKLYVYDMPIGKVSNFGYEINVEDKLFLQEVRDTVQRLGLGYRVV